MVSLGFKALTSSGIVAILHNFVIVQLWWCDRCSGCYYNYQLC